MIFGRCKLHTKKSAGPPKWYNSPGLSLGCWVATCLVRSRWHSDAAGTGSCFKPCDFVA